MRCLNANEQFHKFDHQTLEPLSVLDFNFLLSVTVCGPLLNWFSCSLRADGEVSL